jgi:hypothetical protein
LLQGVCAENCCDLIGVCDRHVKIYLCVLFLFEIHLNENFGTFADNFLQFACFSTI